MIAALLLATATQSVIEAERAFAQRAQKQGQWTAFRATAASDAILFVPDPTKAREWLKDRKDPPVSVQWWPTAAWQSCEGRIAVTTGGSLWPDGTHGYFTTVWGNGGLDDPRWDWSLDHGDTIARPRARVVAPPIRRAACNKPSGYPIWPALPGGSERGTVTFSTSSDATLVTRWYVAPDKSRGLTVALWAGSGYEIVLDDRVAAPPPKPE